MTKRERQLAEYVADGGTDHPLAVAWAACPPADRDSGWLFFQGREAAETCISIAPGWRAIPLYAQPTFTDEEREAVEWSVSAARNVDHPAEDTLRNLLERLA